ncbi:MAG: hypothetical protein BMS9Abin37_1368 [Acidobacteriota bacterium]|nr:MAG: hypothetical protein BMS9Abin37_1368 [Acidobacteriota bacterium]
MDNKDKIGFAVGFVFLIAMGIWAIVDPTAMEEYASTGLASSAKQTFAEAWGPKLGIVLVAIGALALVGLHQSE